MGVMNLWFSISGFSIYSVLMSACHASDDVRLWHIARPVMLGISMPDSGTIFENRLCPFKLCEFITFTILKTYCTMLPFY